jgi:hypothetical protein
MWDGAKPQDVLNFAAARRAEQILVEEFPSGAPDTSDQQRWLRFNAFSIQLAILLDQLKAGAFKIQIVRQITRGNCLGILLCVRSLIEHRALVAWLPNELGGSLDVMAKGLEAAASLPDSAVEVAQPLANFLSVHAGRGVEDQRSWVVNENGGTRTAWLRLDKIVKAAFAEEDRLHKFYALASAAMHSRSQRGCELVFNYENEIINARFVELLSLERLCDRDEEMDYLALSLQLFMQLDHASRFGGSSTASTDTMAKQVFGRSEEALILRVDYTGDGTRASPFKFAPHLQCHQASYALLRQLGVDVANCRRVLDHSESGIPCDRWQAVDRDYWIEITFAMPVSSKRERAGE